MTLDLRSEVQALENTAAPFTTGKLGQESMRSRVLRLIPEGSVLVTEDQLVDVLDYWRTTMVKQWVKGKGLTTRQMANSLLADLRARGAT